MRHHQHLAALFALSGAILTSCGAVAMPGPAQPAASTSATATWHGLRTTLTVPRTSYPGNALVLVTVAQTNVTSRTLHLYRAGGFACSLAIVSDASASGTPLYPPVLRGDPPVFCPDIAPTVTLRPGKTYRWSQPVIARGPLLRTANPGVVNRPAPTLRLRLHPGGTPPKITILSRPSLHAIVAPPGQRRYLYYAYTICASHEVSTSQSTFRWLPVRGRSITPSWNPTIDPPDNTCPVRREWHLVVGTPGSPVAGASWKQRLRQEVTLCSTGPSPVMPRPTSTALPQAGAAPLLLPDKTPARTSQTISL